jgi:hypothetical protein
MSTLKTLIPIAAATLLLVACGGGGGSSETLPIAEQVPDEASASSAGLTKWLNQVATTAPEDKEPLDATRFTPPQPDDTEPVALR